MQLAGIHNGIKAWQDKDDFKKAAEVMILFSSERGEIKLNPYTNRLTGNLKFGDDEED